MGLQSPSDPWILSLAPSLGTLCSVQWMTVSIHYCICQALSKASQQTAIFGSCQLNLAGICNSVWVWWLYIGWIPSWGNLWMALYSVSALKFFYNSLHGNFVLYSKTERNIHTLVFLLLLLEYHVFCNCILGSLTFFVTIYLSVSMYHVSSFVIGLLY